MVIPAGRRLLRIAANNGDVLHSPLGSIVSGVAIRGGSTVLSLAATDGELMPARVHVLTGGLIQPGLEHVATLTDDDDILDVFLEWLIAPEST